MSATHRIQGAPKRPPRPFWLRLHRAFLFPLEFQPLVCLVCLALCGFCVRLWVSLLPPQAMTLYIALLIIPGLYLAAAVARYGCKTIIMGAQGAWHSQEFLRDDQMQDQEWRFLHRKLLLLLWLLQVGSTLLFMLLGIPAPPVLGFSVLLPACTVLLVQNHSLGEAFDPVRWWSIVRLVGPAYVLPALHWVLAAWATVAVLGQWERLLARQQQFALDERTVYWLGRLGVSVSSAILLCLICYFFWAFCHMLGAIMHQHHEALDIEPIEDVSPQGSGLNPELLSPEERARRLRVRRIEEALDRGDALLAWKMAYEEHVKRPRDLDAQQRYWKLMRHPEGHKPHALAEQASHVIALLLEANEGARALDVYRQYGRTCRRNAHAPMTLRLDAAQTLALANVLWIARDAEACLDALKGFDARFEGEPESVAQAFALAARVQAQGRHDLEQAERIFAALKERAPDSIWRREAQAVLTQCRERLRGQA